MDSNSSWAEILSSNQKKAEKLKTRELYIPLFAVLLAISELNAACLGEGKAENELSLQRSCLSPQEDVDRLFAESLKLIRANKGFAARELLERAVKLRPSSAQLRANLGLAYELSGNINEAIRQFDEALKIKPNMPEALLNKAGCFQSLGQTDSALEWFDRYINLNPTPANAGQVKDIIASLKAYSNKAGCDPRLTDYLQCITADGVYRWPISKLPLKVFIADGHGADGFNPEFRRDLVQALDLWMTAAANRLSYQLVPTPEHADMVCDWTSNPAEVSDAGTASERGIAEVVASEDNVIQRARVRIFTKSFLNGNLSSDEMKKACLHEIGHALGLQGHSTNNHDVMFFTVDTATVWPILSKRDKATIYRLYENYPKIPAMPGTGD